MPVSHDSANLQRHNLGSLNQCLEEKNQYGASVLMHCALNNNLSVLPQSLLTNPHLVETLQTWTTSVVVLTWLCRLVRFRSRQSLNKLARSASQIEAKIKAKWQKNKAKASDESFVTQMPEKNNFWGMEQILDMMKLQHKDWEIQPPKNMLLIWEKFRALCYEQIYSSLLLNRSGQHRPAL